MILNLLFVLEHLSRLLLSLNIQLWLTILRLHIKGLEIQVRMLAADIFSIFVKPQEYREFAAPVKLYEYLGYHKPIIASQGTLASTFVQSNGISWTLPYFEKELNCLFDKLIEIPKLLEKV